ncbi:MAG: helix-turn-helix domain-containing protein, partial [Chloroflexi bacterium]|nr:helix-turn-helix domain-containing protein [Chloroflexota bacterium]
MPAFAGVEDALSFGERLRDHRRAAGLTQEELAEQAGLSPRSISELERGGAHIPRRDTVALLARALGLVGAERDAFGAAVERRRGARPVRATVERTSIDEGPPDASGKHNLPRLLTSFVGRQEELHELAPVLAAAPLLTLVGAGGVGKTRLAHELVRQQGASYPDGSWLVELAGLADASLVPGAVATALGLQDVHARQMTSVLTEYLHDRQLLLVLDNCEHLVSACAELVAHLLRACPQLRILATSREPLAIAGEITWRVMPLPLPDAGQSLDVGELTRVPAAQLFVERAHAVNNTLVITPANAAALARICHSVDGIPLALELAAARSRLLTLDELAERLEHDPGVLRASDRAGLPQHRTIRATIDWSHDLLGPEEQMLLRRLSVFAGGWTLDMAVAVCTGGDIAPEAVLDLLAQLVDKSLVLMDGAGPVTRYRLLEPIRQYAVERLEASSEASVYRARHAETLLALAQTAFDSLAGPDELTVLSRLEVDHDNLRTALRWALVQGETARALRSSSALFRFWESRGHFQEGGNWLEQALALPATSDVLPEDRGRALNALANLCWRGGSAERGRPIAELALRVNREAGSVRGVAWSLGNLGMISHLRHEHELAVERLEESVGWARRGARLPLLSLSLTYYGRARLWLNGPHDRRVSDAVDE